MNSTKDDKSSKSILIKGKKPPLKIEALVSGLRKKGITTIYSMSAEEQTQIATWAQEVFDAYGSVIERYTGKIKDLSALPCSKQDIKIAIKVLLPIWCARESEKMVDLLQDRYIRLSAFQEITEEDKDAFIGEVNNSHHKLDATDIQTSSVDHKYMDIILAEQKVLLNEINAYINDLQIPEIDS
jgi:hypothetical protein